MFTTTFWGSVQRPETFNELKQNKSLFKKPLCDYQPGKDVFIWQVGLLSKTEHGLEHNGFYPDSLTVTFPQSNPPPKSRSYSMVSQGSGSSPMSLRRPSQNPPTLFGWSQGHKGSSLYSSKRSLLPDHLMDAREVQHAKTHSLTCGCSQEKEAVCWKEHSLPLWSILWL